MNGVHASATKPSFQEKVIPMAKPTMSVVILCKILRVM